MAANLPVPINPAALHQAFEVLKDYGPGSARGRLSEIDAAVERAAAGDESLKTYLESNLGPLLSQAPPLSSAARKYICEKLAQIGSGKSAPFLVAQLGDDTVAAEALTALVSLPDRGVSKRIEAALPGLSGNGLAGALTALGLRRDAKSTAVLTKYLRQGDATLASAAAGALGQIGTARAGSILRAFYPTAPVPQRLPVADAILVCASHLAGAGDRKNAHRICEVLQDAPGHVRRAAADFA